MRNAKQLLNSAMIAQGTLHGDFSLTVWSAPGVDAVFRISIGTVSKKFRAVFEEDPSNPEADLVPCTIPKFSEFTLGMMVIKSYSYTICLLHDYFCTSGQNVFVT